MESATDTPEQSSMWRFRSSYVLVLMMFVVLWFDIRTGALAAALDGIRGPRPDATSPNPVLLKISNAELKYLDTRSPQEQAERLMQAALNHDDRALTLIHQRLPQWSGQLHQSEIWSQLELAARTCSDLRVRAAAVDINLVVFHLTKNDATAVSLHQAGEREPADRAGNAYALGMLANRGIKQATIRGWLLQWAHDKDEDTRYWAVEGLGMIGTDATVSDLLDIFRTDESAKVRERAGANLAKSGMLSREQRLQAVPGLVRAVEDPEVDDATRAMMFEALQTITDQPLRDRSSTWRDWYAAGGIAKLQEVHAAGPWDLPGR